MVVDKKRVPSTLEEKAMIFRQKEEHPNETWESILAIANLFTENLGRKINLSMESYSHIHLKEKRFRAELNPVDLYRPRLVPAIVIKFEKQLYARINYQLLKGPMNSGESGALVANQEKILVKI